MELIECTKVKLTDVLNSSFLPENVKNNLKESGETFLTIYSKKSKSLRFFPIEDEGIWWLTISIDSLDPETSGKILAKLSGLVRGFVYSTGVCISKSVCFWDGIILESAFKKSKESIASALEDIPNVTNVNIRQVTK